MNLGLVNLGLARSKDERTRTSPPCSAHEALFVFGWIQPVRFLEGKGGGLVRVLANSWTPAGQCAVPWDGRGHNGAPVASGVYFIRADGAGSSAVLKVVLQR